MEPKSSPLESSPERIPTTPEHQNESERSFELPTFTPEQDRGMRVEQENTAQPQSVPITLPVPVPPSTDDQTVTQASDDSPAVAADDDLIEKEWVDKAKKIIAETRDDPHKREKEVGRLQADYLRKRYGKELGASS